MDDNTNAVAFIPQELRLYAGDCYLNADGVLCYTVNDIPVPDDADLNDKVLYLGWGELRPLTLVGRQPDGQLYVYSTPELTWDWCASQLSMVGRELVGLQVSKDAIRLRVSLVENSSVGVELDVSIVAPVELHIMPYNCIASPDGSQVLEGGRFPIDDPWVFPWLKSRYVGEHDWLQTVARFSDGHWGVILAAFLNYGSSDIDFVDIDDEGYVLCKDYTQGEVTVQVAFKADPQLFTERTLEVLDVIDVALLPRPVYPAVSGSLCDRNDNTELEASEEFLQSMVLEPNVPTKVASLFRLSDGSWHFADGTLVIVPSDGVSIAGNALTVQPTGLQESIYLYLRENPAVAREVALV